MTKKAKGATIKSHMMHNVHLDLDGIVAASAQDAANQAVDALYTANLTMDRPRNWNATATPTLDPTDGTYSVVLTARATTHDRDQGRDEAEVLRPLLHHEFGKRGYTTKNGVVPPIVKVPGP